MFVEAIDIASNYLALKVFRGSYRGEVATIHGLKNGRITNMAITGVYKGSLHK